MDHFDVAIVGSGPAGATAAGTLASMGASVALIDKSHFPRDKACGDLIGPRAISLLQQLGIELPSDATRVGDMYLDSPKGKRLTMAAAPGLTYPGHGVLIQRSRFDSLLHDAALTSGATPIYERVEGIAAQNSNNEITTTERKITADIVIGADGANSQVARSLNLIDDKAALYGFALRGYIEADNDKAIISLFDQSALDGKSQGIFPGYGWIFPSANGLCNFGVGIGVGSEKKAASSVTKAVDYYKKYLQQRGVVVGDLEPERRRLGGWLRMGASGSSLGSSKVLLVGDAAGLVNPLQGEGIFAAIDSGYRAALAIVDRPSSPLFPYALEMKERHLSYLEATASLQRLALRYPSLFSKASELLCSPWLPKAIGTSWGLFYNDLIDGAKDDSSKRIAKALRSSAKVLRLAEEIAA